MSTEDRSSQLSPTEAAKQRSAKLGAPVVPQGVAVDPTTGAVIPGVPQPGAPQLITPPGPDPQQMQQYGAPQQQFPQQQPQPVQQVQPGQPMPVQQFMQPGAGQQKGLPPEQFAEGFQALQEAQQREATRVAASDAGEPPPEEETDIADEDEADSPLLQSMDEDLAAAIDQFNNRPRKRRIELSLTPMNVEDLVMKGELRQEVPISCGVKVTFRTTSGLEHDGMLDELGKIAMETSGSELFLRERLANYNLTLSVRSIGNKVLTTHLTKDGEWSIEGFRKKFNEVLRTPLLLLADMRVNCYWFDERVRKIMVSKELGNG